MLEEDTALAVFEPTLSSGAPERLSRHWSMPSGSFMVTAD